MTMQDKSPDAVRQRAQSRFEKATSQAREAAAALKDHQAKTAAEAAKVIRLRNLRLAREASDAASAAQQAQEQAANPAPKKKIAAKPRKSPVQ